MYYFVKSYSLAKPTVLNTKVRAGFFGGGSGGTLKLQLLVILSTCERNTVFL